MKKWMLLFVLFLQGVVVGTPMSQDVALNRALRWMQSNPVMSKASPESLSIEEFPNIGSGYSVYVVQLSPKGYLVLNSDDRLPLLVSFSSDSYVDLTDDPQNAFRAMLLNYCARMEKELAQLTSTLPLVTTMGDAPMGESELYGPFLETSWNQSDPYNLFCPTVTGGLSGYNDRAPVGCVPTAIAQVLNFHRWPYYGRGSSSYTDSSGSATGLHSAVYSDAYDWGNMQSAHSSSDPQINQEAVAELMFELGVAAGVDYEADGTGGSVETLGNQLAEHFFFESVDSFYSSATLIAPMEVDLRAGFPCVISIPGHAVVADGLMVDGGVTTYHINYGWGGQNNGWFTSAGIPGGGIVAGVTSFRPELMAFPETNSISGVAGGSAEVHWILPKQREAEVSQLSIKRLEQQSGTWSSDASEITGQNSGWEIASAGRSGDCWYSEYSEDQHEATSLLLKEVFVPDVSTQLSFWQFARIAGATTFTVEVSVNGGETYTSIYSASSEYDYSWSQTMLSLAAYAGQEVSLRFALSSGSWYTSGEWLGIRIDDLAITSGDWYDWELFATDSTLASRRFSEVTTLWDDCDDFSVFEETLTDPSADWVVSTSQGVPSCFYKAPPSMWNDGCHLTSISNITPTASTRLVLRGKYRLATGEYFKILVSTDRNIFTEVWSASGIVDWAEISVDLSPYIGQSIYVRFKYEFDGSYFPDGGIWIDSVSTQEVTNPEFEGQPVYYTTLTNLPMGTHTLAAVLTDTNAVDHIVGPSFTLTASGPENDTDADGLPNDWELFYFGGSTNANPSAMASNGVNTILEAYVAGLNPTNSESFFDVGFTNGFVIQWNAVSGRVYSIFGTTNLPAGFQPLETNILWPQSSWTDTVNRSKGFYKIDVQLTE